MTDQEIDSLSLEAINEMVARELEWKIPLLCDIKHQDGCRCFDYPDYCHSIEAVWEIVNKLEKDKRQIYIQCRNDAIRSGWVVSFDEVMEDDKKLPMAICKAFLKLKRIK